MGSYHHFSVLACYFGTSGLNVMASSDINECRMEQVLSNLCVCFLELAREHHQSRIVWQCFSEWRLSWECRRKLHAHRKDVEKRAARVALQRAFARWKHCIQSAFSPWQGQIKSIPVAKRSGLINRNVVQWVTTNTLSLERCM